jgi:PBP1b-binding outer membrane lipoprotein LpoB
MKKIFSIAILALAISACTPETTTVTEKSTEQNTETNLSKTEKAAKDIIGSWKVNSIRGEAENEENIISFNENGSVSSSKNKDSGKWTISENDGKLFLNIKSENGDDEISEIKKLDATSLIILNRGAEIILVKK